MKKFSQLGMRIFLSLFFTFAGTGCLEDLWEEYEDSYSVVGDYSEKALLVSGEGETLLLEYGTLVFTAKLNWEDGSYYFAPDPEGKTSGHKIICAASFSGDAFEGDCFRDGRVCTFSFYEAWDDVGDKTSYYPGNTSCKEAASVGPFLVPLESPMCGQDPFPECPSDDLFPVPSAPTIPPIPSTPSLPTTPGIEPVSGEEVDDEQEETGQPILYWLVDELCGAAARCDDRLTKPGCQSALMNGEEGQQIWDDFGLEEQENSQSTADVETQIQSGEITVDIDAFERCFGDLIGTCDNVGEEVGIGDYFNVENIIPEDAGSCPAVFRFSDNETTAGGAE